jgi:hypothetical protein
MAPLRSSAADNASNGVVDPMKTLKKAARMQPMKKVVVLSDGSEFIFWHTPLTLAERQQINHQVKEDDGFTFGLHLFVAKALFENGQRMFNAGSIAELKHDIRDSDLQKLMLAVSRDEDEGAEFDIKSIREEAGE